MSALNEVLDALLVERYGPAMWWHTPPTQHPASAPDAPTNWDDSEATCARRRRRMAEDFAATGKTESEAS